MSARKKFSGDRCRCPMCGEYFNSTRAFDRHRTGTYQPLERRCLTTAEMEVRGMSRNVRGFWITSPMAILGARSRTGAEIGTDPLPSQGVAAPDRRIDASARLTSNDGAGL